MSILQELENIKYRFVLDLIKREEQYDKKRSVINAYELEKIFHDRFLLMQDSLLPLKNRLGNEIDIIDVNFINSDDENGLIVKYVKEGKQYILLISNIDYHDVTITASDLEIQNSDFSTVNRKIILNIFKDIDDNSLDQRITVKSATGKFIINASYDSFMVSDAEKKVFSLEEKHSIYTKNNKLVLCNYSKLKELLEKEENSLSLCKHIYIYEDELSKQLVKRIK